MPIPPIKTIRQVRSLIRQNPGAAAKRIISINNAEKARQSALNGLRQSNLNLRNIDKDIVNTYIAYGPEPPFDPFTAFQRNQALLSRNQRFENWTNRFAPIPNIKVFAERSLGYRGPNYPTTRFMGDLTMFPYSYGPRYPRQIEIGGRTLEEVPLSKINFRAPLVPRREPIPMPQQLQGGYGYLSPSIFSQQNNTSIDPLDALDKELRRLDEETYLPFKKGGKIYMNKK
jgi:hypothetical protein